MNPTTDLGSAKTARDAALVIVRDLRAQGHAVGYIAEALNRRGIPTLSGRPGTRWAKGSVFALMQKIAAEGTPR